MAPGQIDVGCPGPLREDGSNELGRRVSVWVSPSKGKDTLCLGIKMNGKEGILEV